MFVSPQAQHLMCWTCLCWWGRRSGEFTLEEFREAIAQVCSSGEEHLIVSYARKLFQQTGDGHYSPIGGYHATRDLALILDVARFKYPPHWVPVPLLYEAMALMDPATNQPRGFMRLSARAIMDSLLFSLDLRTGQWADAEHFIRLTAPRHVEVGDFCFGWTIHTAGKALGAAGSKPQAKYCGIRSLSDCFGYFLLNHYAASQRGNRLCLHPHLKMYIW